jgi:Na+-transporting methylmalonyl-CoA/oxaloacetate decarboxylase gamma subunit
MNDATTTADGFMLAVAAMAFVYVICVLLFAFRTGKH